MSKDFRVVEKCCNCGSLTREGLYTRVDPAFVRFPTMELIQDGPVIPPL